MDKLEEKKTINFLKSIKSSYIQKWIISFLNEKQKLNMIIYNKQLQKMFDVDIESYKKICGKYKISKRNGKGKEYLLGTYTLIYEGEYKNGIRNGKGKEYYDDGKLYFIGEYLNGKKWNGKRFNKYGYIELEIIDGKGKGKEYYDNGNLFFEGEYLNGERNGKGKEYK